jgi:hypothetical protein
MSLFGQYSDPAASRCGKHTPRIASASMLKREEMPATSEQLGFLLACKSHVSRMRDLAVAGIVQGHACHVQRLADKAQVSTAGQAQVTL